MEPIENAEAIKEIASNGVISNNRRAKLLLTVALGLGGVIAILAVLKAVVT